MGMFNKYFGVKARESNDDPKDPVEKINEFVKDVLDVASTIKYEDSEDQMGDYPLRSEYNEYMRSSRHEEYDTKILKDHEVRILSLVVFGYFLIKTMNLKDSCNNSVINLFEKNNLFKSVVIRFIKNVAQGSELCYAMARKIKDHSGIDLNSDKVLIVSTYFLNRFCLYSNDIISGMELGMTDETHMNNLFFKSAYFNYNYISSNDPVRQTFSDEGALFAFATSIDSAYWNLRKKYSNGEFSSTV